MIDTNKILNMVKNTPIDELMDNKPIMIDENQLYGFNSWQGTKNVGRWFGYIVYRNSEGTYLSGQGTSAKGYTSKENALKYALIEFKKRIKEFEELA